MKHFVFLALAAAVVVAAAGMCGRTTRDREAARPPRRRSPAWAYLRPGTPEVGGVRHLMLIYVDAQLARSPRIPGRCCPM